MQDKAEMQAAVGKQFDAGINFQARRGNMRRVRLQVEQMGLSGEGKHGRHCRRHG